MNYLDFTVFMLLISLTSSIFPVRPTIGEVQQKSDSALNYAREYYDNNNLASISRQNSGFMATPADMFIELLNPKNGLIFYATSSKESEFSDTCDQLDEVFGDAWHDLFK